MIQDDDSKILDDNSRILFQERMREEAVAKIVEYANISYSSRVMELEHNFENGKMDDWTIKLLNYFDIDVVRASSHFYKGGLFDATDPNKIRKLLKDREEHYRAKKEMGVNSVIKYDIS